MLLKTHPEWGEVLLDFFVWKNDPKAFDRDSQSAEWRQYMRLLSFLEWNVRMQMGKCAWGCKPPDAPA